jgi:inosine-uridine nucleoside N-ribohydrolase
LHADDAYAILAAFNSPEVDVIAITTIYGNVPTPLASQNALILTELAGREEVDRQTDGRTGCLPGRLIGKQGDCMLLWGTSASGM